MFLGLINFFVGDKNIGETFLDRLGEKIHGKTDKSALKFGTRLMGIALIGVGIYFLFYHF